MGIDYVIALDCPAKEALGVQEMVDMLKARSRAEAVLQLESRNEKPRPPEQVTFAVMINRNGKVEQTQASVKILFDQAKPLEAHRKNCASCPANRDNPNGFGCYDSISYPIEPDTERWLLSRLPDTLEAPSMAGYLFKSALNDFGWAGEQAADMRSQGETFFRLRTAPARTWQTGETVTGDQVFHMIFHVGHIGSEHAKMVCVFLGAAALVDGDENRANVATTESRNAEQLMDFINTLGFAAANGLDVLVDG